MTEDEAQAWIVAQHGDRALEILTRIVQIVSDESRHQNLIAPSTLDAIWARHIVDSAQLLHFVSELGVEDQWIDIGSGAGFPGLVIAALVECHVTLVEPRKRRAAFLGEVICGLRLQNADVRCCRIEAVAGKATVISARAVAPLGMLFEWANNCATLKTTWILPKGKSAREEVATVEQAWHGVFHVEQSITDPESLIVLASGVARR